MRRRAASPYVNKGELAVVYCFVFFYIFLRGPGGWSIDALIGKGKTASTTLDSGHPTFMAKIDMFILMKRSFSSCGAIFLAQSLSLRISAKERLLKSPRHGEWVDFKSGDRTIKAFVVYPERKDKAPVVLVIHEIFGLTDWVRGVCDQLAENGVIAIAPDLLSGQTFEDVDGARKAISAVTKDQVKADLDADVRLRAQKFRRATGRSRCADFAGAGDGHLRTRMRIQN